MLLLLVKSKLAQFAGWIADRLLGPLARAANLVADDDMCLLLRVEVPRSAYGHGDARLETNRSACVF
jgi:hypothetical protein